MFDYFHCENSNNGKCQRPIMLISGCHRLLIKVNAEKFWLVIGYLGVEL